MSSNGWWVKAKCLHHEDDPDGSYLLCSPKAQKTVKVSKNEFLVGFRQMTRCDDLDHLDDERRKQLLQLFSTKWPGLFSDANVFKTTTDALHEAFGKLDVDGDGFLSRVEFTTFAEVMGFTSASEVLELLAIFNLGSGLELTYVHKSALEMKGLLTSDDPAENVYKDQGPKGDVRFQWVCASVVGVCVCVCVLSCVCMACG